MTHSGFLDFYLDQEKGGRINEDIDEYKKTYMDETARG
jgi:hypothetical protein